MSTQIQYRRGTAAQSDSFTGALGEITVETTNKTLRVHDGINLGGFPLATQANLTITLDKTNAAFDKANAANVLAQGAFDSANNVAPQIAPAFDKANAAFNQANTGTTIASGAFNQANAGTIIASGAFNQANADVTNISTTGAHHGSASSVSAFRVEANGRISSANSTTIAIAASAITSGTLPINRGGTNQTSFTTGNLIFFNGTSLVSIANSGVTAATYGDAANSVSITVDNFGRVTAASNITSSGGGTDFAFFMGSIGLI